MMEAHVGDLGQPLSCLAVHIVQVGEVAQRPEILAHVSDTAALHFSFSQPLGLRPPEKVLTCSSVQVEYHHGWIHALFLAVSAIMVASAPDSRMAQSFWGTTPLGQFRKP